MFQFLTWKAPKQYQTQNKIPNTPSNGGRGGKDKQQYFLDFTLCIHTLWFLSSLSLGYYACLSSLGISSCDKCSKDCKEWRSKDMLLLFSAWPGFLSEFVNKIISYSVFKFVFLLVFLMTKGKNSQQM